MTMVTSIAADVLQVDVPYPETADLSLRLRTGPCRIRLTSADGTPWIRGTYTDRTRTLPLDMRTEGAVTTIAQRVDLRTLSELQLPTLDLAISRARAFALDIETGASENSLDLGGLPLTRLVLKAGAGRFELDFTTPNPAAMTLMDLGIGAGMLTARHLANANFGELRLAGGVSGSTLDFSGELVRDAHVSADAGLASIDIVVPATTSARIAAKAFAAGKNVAGFVTKGDAYYTTPALEGKHPLLEIDVSMAFGSVGLSTT
jgi:hypothetical protein